MSNLVAVQLIVLFALMFFFLFLRVPVFMCLLLASLGYSVIFPGAVPEAVFTQSIVSNISNVNFTAILFYFLLGEIMNSGGLTDRLIKLCKACIGQFRGSLGHINILTSVVFACVSGSAMADTASVGGMMIPAMKKEGYPAGYAAAITETSSIIGPIIPPSTGLVMMGIFMGCSIRRLFLGGILPGLLLAAVLLAVSIVVSERRNFPKETWGGWRNVLLCLREGIGAFVLPAVIMVCFVAGIGTVVEIGAVSCVLAVLLACAYREMSWKTLGRILMNTTIITGKVLCVLAGAGTFVWIVASMGVADWVAAQALALGSSQTGVMAFSIFILFIVGMVLDVGVIQMVLVPVLCPVILAVGIDPIYFSVVCMLVCQLGLCTPPVGSLLYMSAGIAQCSAWEVIKESLPFMAAILLIIVILIAFPGIITSLPTLLMG